MYLSSSRRKYMLGRTAGDLDRHLTIRSAAIATVVDPTFFPRAHAIAGDRSPRASATPNFSFSPECDSSPEPSSVIASLPVSCCPVVAALSSDSPLSAVPVWMCSRYGPGLASVQRSLLDVSPAERYRLVLGTP